MTKKGVVDWSISVNTVTGSFPRSAKRWYLSNSEADFEVFRHAGGNVVSMGVKLSVNCKKLQSEMKICNRK